MKYKYHRTKEKYFSGRCMGARCWSCHAYNRTHDLYGKPLEFKEGRGFK